MYALASAERDCALLPRSVRATRPAADLLLVDGDPATTIADTLNIGGIWRRGARLATCQRRASR